MLITIIQVIVALAIGAAYIIFARRSTSALRVKMSMTETTPIADVISIITEASQNFGEGRGYYEMKGIIYAREPLETNNSRGQAVIKYLAQDNSSNLLNQSGVRNTVFVAPRSSSRSKKSTANLGVLTFVIIAAKLLWDWKKKLDREVGVGYDNLQMAQEIVICDENRNMIWVDAEGASNVIFSNAGVARNNVEMYIPNGSKIFVMGEVYTLNGQVRVGAPSDKQPFVLSGKTEQDIVSTLKNQMTQHILFGASISILIAIALLYFF